MAGKGAHKREAIGKKREEGDEEQGRTHRARKREKKKKRKKPNRARDFCTFFLTLKLQ